MAIGKSKEVIKLTSLLGQNSLCDGSFSSPGSARIDGVVNGNVTVEGTLILGSSGVINGDVNANSVQIAGEVNGNIYAPVHAELTSEAKVVGDLTTAVIVIDENAVFQGKVNMKVDVSSTEPPVKEKGGFFKKSSRKDKKTSEVIENDYHEDKEVEAADENDFSDLTEDELDEEFIKRIISEV